uniref:ATP-dependent Clp protease proteolytic subunit n=1 Tax=Cuscuta japonica TaxID=81913 RepID=A0A3Q8U9G3_CUSJA|nr:clp protease proteolytic subunit [Cuscuta japonica]AZL92864.1 ClpP [Cuscuta japonica]UKO31969.1 clp protease proteolytic subunit [Cuscuta japonica]ULQ63864.1 clp protease proteolytic subunit [Cuscuta japonica]UNB15520.1 clp protease proteolytic subunit [Cuscuta japonica]WCF05609.1 ATP-dependent Clp protease proteolytic subunit [Cuscuta japonica]
MPIGVPRVRFQYRRDRSRVWIDIYNRLYRERCLFLAHVVDSQIANQLVGLFIYLGVQDETKDIFLFINSPGGGIISGFAIYDTMQFVRPDIQTICVGLAASMGSFLLVGGVITKRLAFPHARVMIHQPMSAFFETQTVEAILEAEELLKLRESLAKVYVQRTGKPDWVIAEDMERDVFLSATEAQAYGIVDVVGVALASKG